MELDLDAIAALPEEELLKLPVETLRFLEWQARWRSTARPEQLPPEGDWLEWGLQAGRGFGKQLCVDTDIPTPTGWVKLKDISVGDRVFDENGNPCTVTAVYDPPTKVAYRLTFSDGEFLDAGAEHQWVTWTHRERKQYLRHNGSPSDFPDNWPTYSFRGVGPQIRTTQDIVDSFRHGIRKNLNHCVPVCGDLNYPLAPLPIDPWVLGYWLGNGSTRNGAISTNADDTFEVMERIRASGFEIGAMSRNGRDFGTRGLLVALREIGVLNNKHVPEIYLRSSIDQRRMLLAGLLDSDGHCDKTSGHIEFCTTLKVLSDAVVELARSLGQKPIVAEGVSRLNGVDYGPKWRVTWRPTFNPFVLRRKGLAWRPCGSQGLRNAHRMITDFEQIDSKPMRCLTVDSPNSMFLAGRGMIPTHNTRVGAEWLSYKAITDPQALPKAVIAPTMNDVRYTCFEGNSGILNIIPPEFVVDYNKTNLIITLTNGGIIRGFGSESPERLRGPQNAAIWGDELAAWQYPQETWDMAMMGLRLGPNPQVVWTTTPKPIELVRKLTLPKDKRVITRGATFDNKANLPQSFLDKMEEDYAGTTMGRQEIQGELIDPEEAGIIKRSWFRIWPAKKPLPQFEWVIMSLDTAFTEATMDKKTRDADYSACTVWGVFRHEGKSNCLLLDCWQEQLGLPDLIKRVRKESQIAYGDDQDSAMVTPMYGSSKPQSSGKKIDMIIIEDKGSGISLRQSLEREGIMAYAYNPGRADKLTRLHMVSAVFARRQVWLPESEKFPGRARTWVEPLVAQLCAFTGSGSIKHDDLVDSATQAVRLMMDKNLLTFDRKEKDKEKDRAAEEFNRGPRKAVVNPYAA